MHSLQRLSTARRVPAAVLTTTMAAETIDAAISAQEERIAKLEAPSPPGSPTDGKQKADGGTEPALDEQSKQQIQAAVDFLRNPEVQQAPMSAKINYLHQKLKLGAAGIKVAVGMVYGRALLFHPYLPAPAHGHLDALGPPRSYPRDTVHLQRRPQTLWKRR